MPKLAHLAAQERNRPPRRLEEQVEQAVEPPVIAGSAAWAAADTGRS